MSNEKTKEESGVPPVCMGCGGRDQIVKPFNHKDAGGIYWCGICGTLLIYADKKIDGMICRLTAGVMKAMTGHATANEAIDAKKEADRKAKGENVDPPAAPAQS